MPSGDQRRLAPITFEEYQRLTHGERSSRRGAMVSRPGMSDYAQQELADIVEYIRGKQFVQVLIGLDFDVEVKAHPKGGLIFEFVKASS